MLYNLKATAWKQYKAALTNFCFCLTSSILVYFIPDFDRFYPSKRKPTNEWMIFFLLEPSWLVQHRRFSDALCFLSLNHCCISWPTMYKFYYIYCVVHHSTWSPYLFWAVVPNEKLNIIARCWSHLTNMLTYWPIFFF